MASGASEGASALGSTGGAGEGQGGAAPSHRLCPPPASGAVGAGGGSAGRARAVRVAAFTVKAAARWLALFRPRSPRQRACSGLGLGLGLG